MKAIFRLRMESGAVITNHARALPTRHRHVAQKTQLFEFVNPATKPSAKLASFVAKFLSALSFLSVLLCSSVSLFTCFHSTILGFGAELECRRRAAGCVPVRLVCARARSISVTSPGGHRPTLKPSISAKLTC